MSVADRGWSTAPVGLLRLDRDGYVLQANATVAAWALVADGTVEGRRIGELLTVGGRIYWDTHVVPVLTLSGQVEAVALDLRTTAGPVPVLLTARLHPQTTTVDVALLVVRERAEFEQQLVRARTTSERWAERLRWVQAATAALSQAVGVTQVRDALLATVAQHAAVADVVLARPRTQHAEAHQEPDGRLVASVVGATGSHGDLVVTLHHRPGDIPVDLDALTTIAQQGAIALDRATLHEQSTSVAHELQHAMLTTDLPHRPDLQIAAEYRPAVSGLEVGGDWYDAFWLDPTTLAVVVGDVVGHGLAAATAMGQLRTATRALAAPGLGPAAVIDRVGRFVVDRSVGFGSTLVYGELDTTTARFAYACAGHLPPLQVHRDGRCTYLWDGRSLPLGVPAPSREPRPQGETFLEPGDTMLLYTDGVVERRDETLPEGLNELALAASRRALEGTLSAGIVDTGSHQRDDACALTLHWAPLPSEGRLAP